MKIDDIGEARQRRYLSIVAVYPWAVLLVGVALNCLVIGVRPVIVALPSQETIQALVVAAVLLLANHTWIMTATELTRVRFRMYATPEEWAARGLRREDAPVEGVRELERHHNAHRNATENTVCFIVPALALVLMSPPGAAAYAWLIGFAVARLGYTYGYLAGKDGVRGLFMTLSLLAMYGSVSYLVIALWV